MSVFDPVILSQLQLLAKSTADAAAALSAAVANVEGDVATVGGAVGTVGGAVVALQGTANAINSTVNTINAKSTGIKSVQRGTIAITTTGSSWSATISAVNTAKAELRPLGGGFVSGVGYIAPILVLTNSTTVTATTPGSSGNAMTVGWEITEYY